MSDKSKAKNGREHRAWRMPRKCADCPFASRGKGLHLRKSLGPGRWEEILKDLRDGKYFPCHKTSLSGDESGEYDDNGERIYSLEAILKWLVCAGSIEWQDKHGYSSAYVRLCRYNDQKGEKKSNDDTKRIQRARSRDMG